MINVMEWVSTWTERRRVELATERPSVSLFSARTMVNQVMKFHLFSSSLFSSFHRLCYAMDGSREEVGRVGGWVVGDVVGHYILQAVSCIVMTMMMPWWKMWITAAAAFGGVPCSGSGYLDAVQCSAGPTPTMSERRKQIIANRRNLVQLAYASLTLCTSRTVGLDKVSTSQNKTKHNKREEKRREKRKENNFVLRHSSVCALYIGIRSRSRTGHSGNLSLSQLSTLKEKSRNKGGDDAETITISVTC